MEPLNRDAAEKLIAFLNHALEVDHAAVNELFATRVMCNEAMAQHPTIQVGQKQDLSILGLLNGAFGVDSEAWGCIVAVWDEPKPWHKPRLLRFEYREPVGEYRFADK